MNSHYTSVSALALATVLPFAATAHTQVKPRFVTLPNHYSLAPHNPASSLTQWNGSFVDLTHKTVSYVMIGTNPNTTNTSTTVPVVLIPIKMVYGSTNGNMTFDPNTHTVSNGNTVTQNTLASPLFNAGIDFVQGGVDLGNTQYIDAFQRGNFWSGVSTNTGYHVLLGTPTVAASRIAGCLNRISSISRG